MGRCAFRGARAASDIGWGEKIACRRGRPNLCCDNTFYITRAGGADAVPRRGLWRPATFSHVTRISLKLGSDVRVAGASPPHGCN